MNVILTAIAARQNDFTDCGHDYYKASATCNDEKQLRYDDSIRIDQIRT